MNTTEILALFDREQRRDIDYPDMRKDTLPRVTRFVRAAPGKSLVLYSEVDETTADAAIQEQVAYFAALGRQFEWKVYAHDTPPDLTERLRAHGFTVEDPEAVMVLDLRAAPPALLQPVTADVRPLTRREQIADIIRVETQVWGRDYGWMMQRMGDHLDLPGYLTAYVAYAEGEPACAGWLYFHPGTQFVGLWGGSTVARHRGRGLYTAILATRVQEALRRGYRFLTIDASPMSRPIVAKHGFQLLTSATECNWKPAA